jgi:bifunctional non-homologous end joining protein LigD
MSRAAARRSPARFDASVLPGAKPVPFPGFVEPCHPAPREEAPAGGRWFHEIKFDGYRTQRTCKGESPPSTRGRGTTGRCASKRWPMRSPPLPAGNLILDGEAVVAKLARRA